MYKIKIISVKTKNKDEGVTKKGRSKISMNVLILDEYD